MPEGRKGIQPVPDRLRELDPGGYLEQVRKFLIDVNAGRVAALAGTTTSGASPAPAPTPGPPGPPGPPGTPYVPDLTPPPTPSGVVVSAGLDFVFITTDAPTFSEGNGYQRTIVYGATYGGSGPLPTFSDAVRVHEFVGQVGSFAAEPGVQWHIWLKWLTNDSVESVSPSGGANGHQVTTALIGNVHLGPLIIEAGNLANGAVTTAKFAAGIEPVSIVGALPSPSGYAGPLTVFLTTDGKLYRYVAGAWTTAVAAVDITGQITGTQIADDSISTPKLQANSVTAAQIAANTITANEIAANAITASELAANSVVAGKVAAAAISATEIAAAAIQATHLAANSIAVGTAAIQNGAIVNAMIADAAITNAKIVSLAATKLTAGSIAVGEYIQSSDFVTGVSGWRWGGNTGEVGSAMIRGQLTAGQINANGLVIRDNSGVPILGVNEPLSASYIAALVGGGNLLANSSFEVDSDSNGLANSWTAYSSGTTGAITRTVLSGGFHGAKFQRISATGLGTASSDRAGVYQEVEFSADLPTGTKIVSSIAMRRSSAGTVRGRVFINTFDAADAPLASDWYWTPNLTTDWVRYQFAKSTEAGTRKIRCYYWMDSRSGAAGAASIDIDAAMLQFGDLMTEYTPSAVDKTGIDNPITSANISTYMAAAAIGTAYIQNAAITDAKIASLNASKIVAGTITTDKIQVGATTVSATVEQLASNYALSGASSVHESPAIASLALACIGGTVAYRGRISVEVPVSNATVAFVQIRLLINWEGVDYNQGVLVVEPVGSGTRTAYAIFPIDMTKILGGVAATINAYVKVESFFMNSSMAGVGSPTGTVSYIVNAVLQENKV